MTVVSLIYKSLPDRNKNSTVCTGLWFHSEEGRSVPFHHYQMQWQRNGNKNRTGGGSLRLERQQGRKLLLQREGKVPLVP